MARRFKSLTSRKKVFLGIGISLFVIAGYAIFQMSHSEKTKTTETIYQPSTVTSGKIASSTLLSGTVSALSEQYVYYDNSKGGSARVTVEVGQQIGKGQQLVQYDTTNAQAAYDSAVRNLNKVGRQITQLKTYGVQTEAPAEATTDATTEASGNTASQSSSTSSYGQTYKQQLQDLNDSYADAEAEVAKAQEALNQTVVVSDVEGTVVEVNHSIDPAAKESQKLVHVATQGQLQVKGHLTEYDLANLKKNDEVIIKSKVYPDKKWQGKITSISDYPEQSTSSTEGSGNGSSGSKYEYKVDITSDLAELKQGFSVSVEVVNSKESLLVPTSAVFSSKGKDYVWRFDKLSKKVSKQEVGLGRADATSQEILTGLAKEDRIIANPDKLLKDGQKLSDEQVKSEDTPKTSNEEK
ncbi:efflux RND transporter periplasmic adaptor subunit [Streptococcus pluranimalium]|uniref:Efflux transporter periplasmic adaptor subunit n=1 Tax=Streptococcus pluranimalium TaxID=82348 RepID=A0A2L0D310_9STRE|nr:efflux RND transporter periplasmic adaptor subunit [Streptococcus pluranimalium]AUW96217.1 efflux transporter periplasmic adaptor subunit [Streptococcus pluranimalium]